MPRIEFNSFAVDVPEGWTDITDTVEADDPPCTLAREDGVGALQLSIATYRSGRVPDPTTAVLKDMVEEFARERELGKPSAWKVEDGPPMLAAAFFAWGNDFLRVWHLSDGRNFAFITYTCEAGRETQELADCEWIVRTVEYL